MHEGTHSFPLSGGGGDAKSDMGWLPGWGLERIKNGDNISGGRELKNGRVASTLSDGKFMSPKVKLLDPSKERRGRTEEGIDSGDTRRWRRVDS